MEKQKVEGKRMSGKLASLLPEAVRLLGLRGKLLAALLPPIILVLLVAGYVSYRVSGQFIDIALSRTVRMHTLAIAHEVEHYLDRCRLDLLLLSQGEMSPEILRAALESRLSVGDDHVFELAYLPGTGGHPSYFVQRDGKVQEIAEENFAQIQPNPLLSLEMLSNMKPGEVRASSVKEVIYPLPSQEATNRFMRTHVIRFVTRYPGRGDAPPGLLILSVQAARVRNILSLYNSDKSPLWSFPRSAELRFSYLLDRDAWILFQSEIIENPDKELTTFLAREAKQGTLGRQGHATAFRPNEHDERYWKTVSELRAGLSGLEQVEESEASRSGVHSFFHSYAPVMFREQADQDPVVYGGVVFVDRSQLPIVAGYRYLDVMLFVTMGAIVFLSLVVFWFGRLLTRPIRALANQMNDLSGLEALEEIRLPYSGFDMDMLQRAINSIIRRVKEQVVELQVKNEAISNVNKRERASLKRETEILAEAELNLIPEIIGQGPAMSNLKADILKAAQVDVDVLISGDTGTGKQLVAEAIHSHGVRNGKPLVSINCGALDENLLLDALFGHIKGAFSEAKADRNGAFVEADGGTLFLDEIQSASPKVQQSLLRAIATRKIKPLGSDKELSVNVRIVAATNEDMPRLIERGVFREDLYYRLKVISIVTPSLRTHPENIPLLCLYYLRQAEQLTGRTGLGLSNGALKKLMAYQWPGNVRELVNSITRAAVMAETEIIQAEEIRLEGAGSAPEEGVAGVEAVETRSESQRPQVVDDEDGVPESGPTTDQPLSERQSAVWPDIRKRKNVTRKDYQELVGGNLPTRTAIYDLQDFVKRGLLHKRGRGPSTRYEVVGKG